MWILESSSELFQGRRMWLKPGKQYLFGRVKKDGVRFAIDNKTISRKHFTIKIDDVRIEDVGNIHARTKVIIEDQSSKAGTSVNGEPIKGSSKELKYAENYIKPGNLPEDLVLKWCPCVLTYNLLKKEIKAEVLKKKQERLKDLDIKVVSEYVAGQTTYLVVNKRNTPKSLQTLIDGKHLVAESYIDALEYAATPSDLSEEENLSPLEQDFDGAWPSPVEHLPPPGRELTTRPADSYQPNPARKNIFQNFTFVFLDQNQFDNLLPPITAGHGKALLCKIIPGETSSSEVVTFMQNAAGRKGFGDHQKDLDKGGVILVRLKGGEGFEGWTNTLVNEAALTLDQRAIDQGEFLDAILANDGSLLRQVVPYEDSHNGMDGPQQTTNNQTRGRQDDQPQGNVSQINSSRGNDLPPHAVSQQASHSQKNTNGHRSSSNSSVSQADVDQRRRSVDEDISRGSDRRARFVMPKKSRVLDFDDDFDPDSVSPYVEDDQDSTAPRSQSQSHFTPELSAAGSEEDAVKDEPRSSRKHRRSPSEGNLDDLDDDMDDLLPAAAAMKRRKLALAAENGTSGKTAASKPVPAPSKKPKKQKEIDVREIARSQRKAEEDKIKKEQEAMDEELRLEPGQALPVFDVETVIIDLPVRKSFSRVNSCEQSDRWDAKWNGRKNFKGFRRVRDQSEGANGVDTRRKNHSRVIVPLVDAKTATYGMGEEYWSKTQEEKQRNRERKKRASQRTTQSDNNPGRNSQHDTSQTIGDEDDNDHETANRASSPISSELSRLQREAASITDHGLDVDEPRKTRLADTQTQSQMHNGDARGTKRAGGGNHARGTAAKKQKTLPVTVVHGSSSDSDDSDDMKFKFGSRSRRGKGRA